MYTFGLVSVLIFCSGLSNGWILSHLDKESESVVVTVTKTGRGTRSIESIGHDNIQLDFDYRNTKCVLHLTRNEGLVKPSHVYVLSGGRLELQHVPESEDVTFFQDHANVASFVVQGKEMYGIFNINGSGYHMRLPTDSSTENGVHHADVLEMETNLPRSGFIDNYETGAYPVVDEAPRRVKRATGQHLIELLMVCDYSVYKYWYDKSTKPLQSEREAEALGSVRQYYAFMINGMDTMYKNIQTSQYTMSIVYAGIIISKTSSDAPWTENYKSFSTPRYRVDSGVALNAFETWVKGTSGLPGYDHAMLFTKYDLTSSGSSVNAGLANLGRMCSPESVSIVEENFDFVCVTTAAHELGHGLSAQHDGLGNTCSQSSAYIMAAVSSPQQSVSTASNPWRFSTCSTQYFTNLINTLDGSNSNCMKTLSPGYNPNGQAPYNQYLPGQLFTADQQCQEIYGPNSYLCREQYNGDFSTICGILWCHDPATTSTCRSAVAGSGTHCGNYKWCVSGQCVTDARAPAGVENCLYGDKVGIIFSNTGWTCTDMYAASPFYCQQTGILCCGTCNPTTPAPSTTPTTTTPTTTTPTTTPTTTRITATTVSTVRTTVVTGPTTTTVPPVTTPAADNTISKFKVIVVMVGAVTLLIAVVGGILFCLCCRKKKNQTKKRKETIRRSKQYGYTNQVFSDVQPSLGNKKIPVEIDDGPRVYTIPKNSSLRNSIKPGYPNPPPYSMSNGVSNGSVYANSIRY